MCKKCKKFNDKQQCQMRLSLSALKIKEGAMVAVAVVSFISLSACERLPSANYESADRTNINKNALSKYSPVIDAKLPKPTTVIDCAQLKAQQIINIKNHSVISQGCDLSGKSVRFILDSSRSSLDCQGAMLSPMADDQSNASAITIKPKSDAAIKEIAVANCHIDGYGHALHIRQYSQPNQRYARGFIDPAANRALAPRDIHITNFSSTNSRNSGIFVGDHVYAVTFDQIWVQNAGTVGLYLEFGSRNNVIKNSVFIGNGFRPFKPNREAIAIDSSENNRIENNQFVDNGAGSILLYRNCFEHANDPAQSNHFKRTQSSRDNVISDNIFRDEPVGIWVASRQSRNLKGFECGAYLLNETPFSSYYLDSAKNNKIINNRFERVEQGIIVEDDGTQITGNQFASTVSMPISVGSKICEDSEAGAVINTLIKNNIFTDKTTEQAINVRSASKTATEIQ